MIKFWQKILVIGGLGLALILVGKIEVVSAQAVGNEQVAVAIIQDKDGENKEMTKAFGEMTKSLFKAISYGFIEVTSGITFEDIGNGQQAVYVDSNNSLIGMADKAFVAIGTLPISVTGQIQSGLETIGLSPVQKVNAQGYGYSSLIPLMEGWRIFRNIAYIFFTVIILVVGIMILFQQKFDGGLVLTVQKAIPGIILSLIMVTFSYAIVGLLIDAMYLLMFLFSGLFSGTEGLDPNKLMSQNILTIGGTMMWDGVGSLWSIFGSIISGDSAKNLDNGGVSGIASFIVFDIILYGLIGGLLNVIFTIVLIIVVLINIWKLFVILLKSYVLLILNTLFAPILLMLGAIPGNQGVKKWFNAIIGNLSAFVGVFVIMVIYFFVKSFGNNVGGGGNLFVPPYIVGGIADGSGINFTGVAMSILGLGIIITLPELIAKIRKKMGAESGFLGEMAQTAASKIRQAAPVGTSIAGGAIAGGLAKIPAVGKFMEESGIIADRKDFWSSARMAGSKAGQTASKVISGGPIKYGADVISKRGEDRDTYVQYVKEAKEVYNAFSGASGTSANSVERRNAEKFAMALHWAESYASRTGIVGSANDIVATDKGFAKWRHGKPKPPSI